MHACIQVRTQPDRDRCERAQIHAGACKICSTSSLASKSNTHGTRSHSYSRCQPGRVSSCSKMIYSRLHIQHTDVIVEGLVIGESFFVTSLVITEFNIWR